MVLARGTKSKQTAEGPNAIEFVPPMLATRVSKLPTGGDWHYRIEAIKQGSRVEIFSRSGTSYTDRFKSVTKAVGGVHADTAVLDGEVVATDATGLGAT
jgi:bifunctional non-homologous end joining protein LigD